MTGESNGEIICPSCGLRNRAEANFCGGCGHSLRVGLVCSSCGAAVEGAYRFCGSCGSRIDRAQYLATDPARGDTHSTPRAARVAPQGATSFALPAWSFSRLTAALSRPFAPIAVPLLASGALLVAAAQAYLTFANEPGKDAPALGIIALVAGFALFALGTFGRGDDAPDTLDSVNIPALQSAMGRLTWAKAVGIGLGVLMSAMLAARLLAGSESGWDLLLWLLAIGAFAVPFIRRPNITAPFDVSIPRRYYADIVIALALVGVFVWLNTYDLTSWRYSAIGDEYAFYNFARELAEDGLQRPFDLDGVYGKINPVMSSIYPASVMWLLGIGNYSWKLSLIISIAITIPGMYILGHIVAGRTGAIVSSVIFAFSHYIFAFMHIGYPNSDVLPIVVWSVVLFLLGLRRGSLLLIYASGLLAGFGLLFNIVARAAMIVIFLYALSQLDIRRRLVSLWPWALGVCLTVLPLFLVNGIEVFTSVPDRIVSPSSQHASEYEGIPERILANAVQNLLAFNYNSRVSHYVSGSLLDPISAALALLGLGYCLGTIRKASSRLPLVVFAVIATGTALLSPYPYVPITRMSAMLIPLALMGGLAAAYLIRIGILPSGGDKPNPRTVPVATVLALLAAAVLALNAWQFWVATPKVFHHTREAVAIGAMRSNECTGNIGDVLIVGKATVPVLTPALESYHPGGMMPRLIDHEEIIAGESLPVESPRCIVLMNPNEEEIQPFKQDLVNRYPDGRFSIFANPSGKTSVEIFAPSAG